MVSVVAPASILSGCGRHGKTDPGYGPSAEWIDDMRDRIRKGVDDPDTVTELLLIVNDLEKTMVELDKEVRAHYANLEKLYSSYGTTRQEFEDTMSRFGETRETYFLKFVDYIFEAKKAAGREYWDEVSDIEKTLYEDWRRPFVETSMQGGSK
jgi:hypothetical protein